MADKFYTVYYIKNTWNNRLYIGITNDFVRRKAEHLNKKYRSKNKKKVLYKSMNAFGEAYFEIEILFDHLLKEEAAYIESFIINGVPTYAPFGYNKAKETYRLKYEKKLKELNPTLFFKAEKFINKNKNKVII